MRPLSVLLCAAGLAVVASGAGAQTLPTWGCTASPSCQQSGFSTYTGQYRWHTGIAFDIGWDHGAKVELLKHPTYPEELPKLPEQRFHVHPPTESKPLPKAQPAAPADPAGPRSERQASN